MAHDLSRVYFTAQASMRNDLGQYGFLQKVGTREVATCERSFYSSSSADTTKDVTKEKVRSLKIFLTSKL